MIDEEKNKRADLFGESSARPLFGSEEPAPAGKPLFDNEFSDPGDAAFVKPLFGDSQADEEEPVSLDDFQEYDNLPEDETIVSPEVSQDEPSVEYVEPVQEENSSAFAEAESPVPEPCRESDPPFSEDVFKQEEAIPEPAFTIPANKVALPGDLESMSLGALMSYARETAGFTPENVYEGTKISERFLNAIESDQFDNLPSGAFPGAYVRALCSFYHLENDACEVAQKKAAAYCTACRPPDDIYDQLPQHAIINKEDQEKFRRWVTIAGVVLFSIILTVIVIVIVSLFKDDESNVPPAPSPVKMEEIEQLDPEPSPLKATELDLPPAKRR